MAARNRSDDDRATGGRSRTRPVLSLLAELATQYPVDDVVPRATAPDQPVPDDPLPGAPPDQRLAELAAQHAAAVDWLAVDDAEQATLLLHPVVAGCRALLGAEHPDTLTVEGALAVALTRAGYTGSGVERLTAVVDARARVLGPQHADTLVAQDALATALRLAGQHQAAVELAAQVATTQTRLLGPAHPDTLGTRLNLGLAHAAAGDARTACSVLEAVLRDTEHDRRALRRHAIVVQAALASCHAMLGLVGAAVGGLARAVDACLDAFGPTHPETVAMQADLAELQAVPR
jgi:hypothetical protein